MMALRVPCFAFAAAFSQGLIASAQCPLAFGPPDSYSAGGSVLGIAAGDFDGDGSGDLVTAGARLTVFLGLGDGTYDAGTGYATTSSVYSVAVGYLNGDDALDIVATMDGGDAVVVLLGVGDGTFFSAGDFPTGVQPVSVSIADFNGDLVNDLVTADSVSGTVSVLPGLGDGSFAAPISAGGVLPGGIDAVDLDGNGTMDVVVSDLSGDRISTFLGNGDGTLGALWHSDSIALPIDLDAGDLSGDGIPDVAVADLGMDAVVVYLGNGDGTLSSPVSYPVVGTSPWDVVIADLNNDGAADLSAVGPGVNGTSVLVGEGNGTFQDAVQFPGGAAGTYLAAGHLDGDGAIDIAFASATNAVVLLNQGGASILLSQQPQNAFIEAGQDAAFSVVADNVVSYQWRKDGVALIDGATYGGVTTDTLTITGPTADEQGVYEVVMQASCNAGLVSRPAALCVDSGGNPCPADFNGDGTIDTRDVLAFLNAWVAGC